MVPNVVWFWKNYLPTCVKSHENFFSSKNGLHEKMFAQKVTQYFFGHVWENSGQNPSHPKTFAFSYTYVLHYITFPDFCVQQSHATNPPPPYLEVNVWRFDAVIVTQLGRTGIRSEVSQPDSADQKTDMSDLQYHHYMTPQEWTWLLCIVRVVSAIGVGAGKFLGVRMIFAQISSNFLEKILDHFCANIFLWRPFLEWKKVFMWFCTCWGPIFFNQSTLDAIFAHIFSEFVQIFRDIAKVFTDFAQISAYFSNYP